MNHSAHDKAPVQAVIDFYTALRDSHPGDIAALTTPSVFCLPLVSPGPRLYHGQQGMADLSRYMHAAYGNYTVTTLSATAHPGPQVTIRARIDPQPGHGTPRHTTTAYTFRDGLIDTITSLPGE